MIRLALVEDHIMFRQATKMCLELTKEFKVVTEASCGAEFEKNFNPNEVDVVLMDLRLQGQHGSVTCLNLRNKFPQIKVIILSQYDDEDVILSMIRYGASAYLTKSGQLEHMIHTIRMVMKYGYYFDQNLGEMMVNEMKKVYKKVLIQNEFRVEFSEIEMRIATLSCSGLTNEQIAHELDVTKRSVENHRTNMQLKTDSTNFQSVVIYLFKHYLLFPQQF